MMKKNVLHITISKSEMDDDITFNVDITSYQNGQQTCIVVDGFEELYEACDHAAGILTDGIKVNGGAFPR